MIELPEPPVHMPAGPQVAPFVVARLAAPAAAGKAGALLGGALSAPPQLDSGERHHSGDVLRIARITAASVRACGGRTRVA